MNTAWKKRWFEAQDDKLIYYKSRTSKKPSGFIPLNESVIKV